MNVLEALFIKNADYDKGMFAKNLYYSNHLTSFVRFEKTKFELIKTYSKIEIINDMKKTIGDLHTERKSIVKVDLDRYFVRIISDDLGSIYDILIYTINNDDEYDKYLRIFFPKELVLDDYLNGLDEFIVLHENNHFKIIKYNNDFLRNFGYQSWDYENKSSGLFDVSIINKNEAFNLASLNKDFNITLKLVCNNQDIIDLNVSFKYYKDNYYIISIS